MKRFTVASSPLRHAYVPIEHLTSSGEIVFRTSDREAYRRGTDGSIRRMRKKIGKKERKRARP